MLSYIIDYGREHGLTSILNHVLNDPEIREKFSENFKEISSNNYKFKYSILHDAAIEVESSVVFTSKTFIPRSFRFNITLHAFGMSMNFAQLHLRLEGLDEVLKASLIDNLASEKLLKKILEKPESLIELLNIVSSKVGNLMKRITFSK